MKRGASGVACYLLGIGAKIFTMDYSIVIRVSGSSIR